MSRKCTVRLNVEASLTFVIGKDASPEQIQNEIDWRINAARRSFDRIGNDDVGVYVCILGQCGEPEFHEG